jgi:hypothetical protein
MIYSQDGRLVSRTMLLPMNKNIYIELPETNGIYNLVIRSKEGAAYLRVLKL